VFPCARHRQAQESKLPAHESFRPNLDAGNRVGPTRASVVSIFPMSHLDPFTIKSLRQMREELVDMQKSELTFKSAN
jgi:hypothetical protein